MVWGNGLIPGGRFVYNMESTMREEKQKMQDYIVNVCGDVSNVSWLIKGTKNILYDPGMAYSAEQMIENVKKELKDAPLDAVLLSHSHYDHVAALPYVKKEWPNAVVYGSAHAAEILKKSSVRNTIRKFNEDAARGAGVSGVPPWDEECLQVDVAVKEGDVIVLGNHEIAVYETPGHTRCSLSYLVDRDVMFASETVGLFSGERYMPCYLVGYQICLDAVEKLRKARARRVFISHRGIQERSPEEIWDFLESQIIKTRQEIIGIIHTCETEEEQLLAMKERYHDSICVRGEQPDFAFLLNAKATLRLIGRECMEEKT